MNPFKKIVATIQAVAMLMTGQGVPINQHEMPKQQNTTIERDLDDDSVIQDNRIDEALSEFKDLNNWSKGINNNYMKSKDQENLLREIEASIQRTDNNPEHFDPSGDKKQDMIEAIRFISENGIRAVGKDEYSYNYVVPGSDSLRISDENKYLRKNPNGDYSFEYEELVKDTATIIVDSFTLALNDISPYIKANIVYSQDKYYLIHGGETWDNEIDSEYWQINPVEVDSVHFETLDNKRLSQEIEDQMATFVGEIALQKPEEFMSNLPAILLLSQAEFDEIIMGNYFNPDKDRENAQENANDFLTEKHYEHLGLDYDSTKIQEGRYTTDDGDNKKEAEGINEIDNPDIDKVVTIESERALAAEVYAELIKNGTLKVNEEVENIRQSVVGSEGHPVYTDDKDNQAFEQKNYNRMDAIAIAKALMTSSLEKDKDGNYLLPENYPIDRKNVYITKNEEGRLQVNISTLKFGALCEVAARLNTEMKNEGIDYRVYAEYAELDNDVDMMSSRGLANSNWGFEISGENADAKTSNGIPMDFAVLRFSQGIVYATNAKELGAAILATEAFSQMHDDPEFEQSVVGSINEHDEIAIPYFKKMSDTLKREYGVDVNLADNYIDNNKTYGKDNVDKSSNSEPSNNKSNKSHEDFKKQMEYKRNEIEEARKEYEQAMKNAFDGHLTQKDLDTLMEAKRTGGRNLEKPTEKDEDLGID